MWMNFKKIIKHIGICSFALMASTANADLEYSFLVGGSAGFASQSGDLDVHTQLFAAGPRRIIDTGYRKFNLNDSGFTGGVFAGVQALCNRFLMGLELSVDWDSLDETRPYSFVTLFPNQQISVYHNVANAKYERGTVLGLSGRVGYKVKDWLLPYVRLGVVTSDDEVTFVTGLPTLATSASAFAQDSDNVWRWLVGFGAEVPVFYRLLTGRVEYNYHSKGRAVKAHSQSNDVPLLASSPTYEYFVGTKQDHHIIKFSLVLNFPSLL